MNIKEELAAVTKWITNKSVTDRIQDEEISALFIADDGNGTLTIAGAVCPKAAFAITEKFIHAMMNNVDKKRAREFRLMLGLLTCELFDEDESEDNE